MFKKFSILKFCSLLLVGGVGLGLLDPFSLVMAQNAPILEDTAQIVAVVIDVILVIALIALEVTAPLLGTEYLTSDDVLEQAIRPMWVFVRNLVNLMFVGVIIFIALGNLYSSVSGSGNWTIKEKLPKLIAAMVLINFSLLGCVLLIDAAYVMTVALFGISDRALETKTAQELLFREDLCNVEDDGAGSNAPQFKKDEDKCRQVLDPQDKFGDEITFAEVVNSALCDGDSSGGSDKCILSLVETREDEIFDDPNVPGRNVLVAVASQMMHIELLPIVTSLNPQGVDDIFKLINTTLFSLILSLAFIIAFVGLFIASLARLVFLWLVMIASPLIVADIVLGLGWIGSQKDKIVDTFIMPVKVAAAFGLCFAMVANMITLELDEKIGGFVKMGPSLNKFGEDGLAILWQVATIMVFWFALWAAMEKSIAGGITNKIKGFGESLGNLAVQGAANIPIIPTSRKDKDGKKISITPNMLFSAEDVIKQQTRNLTRSGIDNTNALLGLDNSVNKLRTDLNSGFKNATGGEEIRDSLNKSNINFDYTDNKDITSLIDSVRGSKLEKKDELIKELELLKKETGRNRKTAFTEAFRKYGDGDKRGSGKKLGESLVDAKDNSSGSLGSTTTKYTVDTDGSNVASGGKILINTGASSPSEKQITRFEKDKEIHIKTTDNFAKDAIKNQLEDILQRAGFEDLVTSNYTVEEDNDEGVVVIKKRESSDDDE